jgi:hypothetical protein
MGKAAIAMLAGLAAGFVLWLAATPRWFDLYGMAAALLLAVPGLHLLLWRGLKACGRSPWPALIVSLPIALGAAIQIGFWSAYFGDPKLAVALGTARGLLAGAAGPYLPFAAGAFLLLAAWVAARALLHPRR